MISLASMSLATLPFLAGLIPLVGGDLLWLSLAGPARPALSHHHPCNAVVAVKHCSPGLPQQHPTFFFGEGGDVDESYLIRFPHQPHKRSAVLFVNR